MSITVLYRKSSGEVVKISVKGQTFVDRNQTYWGVLTDPSLPDGNECRPEGGDLRVLGFAKINDSGTVRNATQPEIDSFAAFEDDDENSQDADAAIDLFESHPRFRKMMIAFADVIKDEINILRQQHSLSDRTLEQLKTAIKNRINKDD
jgi:hypothetical protein